MLYSLSDFLEKIDHEGGAYGALDYGLNTSEYHIPKYLADQWAEIASAFRDLDSLVEEFFGEAYRVVAEMNPEED